jgi:hypothetical protein
MAEQKPEAPKDPKVQNQEKAEGGGATKPVDTGAQQQAAEQRKKEGGYQ